VAVFNQADAASSATAVVAKIKFPSSPREIEDLQRINGPLCAALGQRRFSSTERLAFPDSMLVVSGFRGDV